MADNPDTKVQKVDGWDDFLEALAGTSKKTLVALTEPVLTSIFDDDGIARKVVERIVTDSTKKGFELSANDSDYKEIYKDLNFVKDLNDLHVFDRLYGGAALVYIYDDGADNLLVPLNTNRCKSIKKILMFDRYEIIPSTVIDHDPHSDNFGKPLVFDIQTDLGANFQVHNSRIFIKTGTRTSSHSKAKNDGYNFFGNSALKPVYQYMCGYLDTLESTGLNVENFTFTLLKMAGLSNLLATGQKEQIKDRLKIMQEGQKIGRMLVVDEKESLERKSGSLAGASQVIEEFKSGYSAAADKPHTVLWGKSPSGMNSTGESDLQIWGAKVSDYQENNISDTINDFNKRLISCKDYKLPKDLPEITFPPYIEMSTKEKAETAKMHAETLKIYDELDVLTEEQIFNLVFKNGYSESLDLEVGDQNFDAVEPEDTFDD